MAVEHSPLALPDSAYNMLKGVPEADVNFAHAMTGSIVSGIGLSLAMQGRVTLAAPVDPKQNELFYASGRKPYSVQIGDKWVPMQYFGPFGLSMMLPEAMKDAVSNANASKDIFGKSVAAISNVTRMVIATTPLPTISQFLDMLNGSAQVNPATVGAGLAGQVIPLDAMVRYISGIVDPVYRKATTFGQKIQSGIPGMTQSLPAYTTPLGQPETRNTSNYVAPYGIGIQNNQFEPAFQSRQTMLNSNAMLKQANANAQTNTQNAQTQGQQVTPDISKLPDGKFAYSITDSSGNTTIKSAKDQATAQAALDKNNFTNSDQGAALINGVMYIKDSSGNITSIKKADLTPSTGTDVASLEQQATAQKQAITLMKNSQLFNVKSMLTQQMVYQMIQNAGGNPQQAYFGAVASLPAPQQAQFANNYLHDQTNGNLNSRISTLTQNGVLNASTVAQMNKSGLIDLNTANALRNAVKNVAVSGGYAVGVGSGTGTTAKFGTPGYGAARIKASIKSAVTRNRMTRISSKPKRGVKAKIARVKVKKFTPIKLASAPATKKSKVKGLQS
jgi:hypothetical protein